MAARIQTMPQARATGTAPRRTKRIRFSFQGFKYKAMILGNTTDITIPARIFMDMDFFVPAFFREGAGFNIRGRIRMPEINRTRTRISLTPVKAFSFMKGIIKMFLYFKDSRICQSYSGRVSGNSLVKIIMEMGLSTDRDAYKACTQHGFIGKVNQLMNSFNPVVNRL